MSSVPRAVLIVSVLIVSSLAGVLPVGSSSSALTAPRAVAGGLAAPLLSHGAPVATVHPGVHPHPSVLGCNPMIPWPAWTFAGDGLPPTPFVPLQTGCGGTLYAAQDEVHASFLSDVQGSGQHWSEGIHLPADTLQYQSYGGFYLGDVVKGDPLSAYNESYAEVTFWPVAPSSFTMTVSVYTLENDTNYTGRQINPGNCSSAWFTLAWNSTYWCEGSDFANGAGIIESTVNGGDWLNLSFAGTAPTKHSAGTPLNIWANDSTTPASSWNVTLNNQTTGTFNFTPAFSYANETNLLGWGMGEANGIGIANCPVASRYPAVCDSYNASIWYNTPSLEFSIPQFFTGSSYAGDFQFIGFESTSGACGYVAGSTGNPTVAICVANTAGSGGGSTGYYPYFTYNGTRMDYGTTDNWSTWDFGGPSIQFNPAGTMNAKVPLYLDRIVDNSRGGYVTNITTFNVTARLQVVGHLANASLVYQVPGSSSWISEAMTQVNGSSSIGYFNGTIAGGAAGLVQYWVFAEDEAGEGVSSIVYDVARGPLPTFNIQVVIDPQFCGTVVLNGTSYTNGQTAHLQPGSYTLGETGCWPYINPVFLPSHLLTVYQNQQRLNVRGSGTLSESWTFNPPKLNLRIAVAPSSCAASVQIDSNSYLNGNTAIVTWNHTYTVVEYACAQYDFAGYSGSAQVNVSVGISSTSLVVTKNGTLTLNYAPLASALPLLFLVAPGDCGGGVVFNGATYQNDTSIAVSAGTFPLSSAPCTKLGFLDWIFGGNPLPTFSNGNVTLSSESTIEMIQFYLTIITVLTNPANCGTVYVDGTPYANGQSFVVANNSTQTIDPVPCAGYSLLGVGVNGGLSLTGDVVTANGSGDIQVSFTNATYPVFVGFETNPAYCGSIGFNGGVYQDTNSTQVAPGTVASLSATPCAGEGFLRWIASGGVTVVGNVAYVNTSGSILAVFTELVNLYITTSPTNCGAVVLGGVSYVDGSTPAYPIGATLTLNTTPCAGYVFSDFHVVGVAVQNNGTQLQINDPGTLYALFTPVTYTVTTILAPLNCGTVFLNAQPTYNNTSLQFAPGIYPLIVRPCQGDEVSQIILAGGVAVVGPSGDQVVYVNGSGSITILFGAVPPVLTLSVPATAGAGLGVFFGASIAVLVEPFNYTYNWSFGDGSNSTTTVNSTEHVYDSPGTYLVKVTVTDPLGRTVTGSASIAVSSLSSTAQVNDAIPALIAVGLAVIVIAAAWVYSGRRGPPTKDASEDPDYTLPGPAEEPGSLPGPVEPSSLTETPSTETPPGSP